MSEMQIKKDPAILNYVSPKKLESIKECYHDEDGYWIILNEGWEASNMDSGCKTIHEDTVKQLRYQISGIRKIGSDEAEPSETDAAAEESEQITLEAAAVDADQQERAEESDGAEDCRMYTKAKSTINGRNVWHYQIVTPIGEFHAVEFEHPDGLLSRFIFDSNHSAAEKKYKSILCSLAKGTL